jgi:hypothetical protein
MSADLRSLVMLPGRCSACRQPAEQRAGSGRWWHAGPPCEWRSVSIFRPVDIYPVGDNGGYGLAPRKVKLPARFIPDTEETP